MTGDAFKRLLLGLALAGDRGLRRVILRLAETAPPPVERDAAGPQEKVFRFPEAGPERTETRSGPPKHWIDRVRKHAPELLLPAGPGLSYDSAPSAPLPGRQTIPERQASPARGAHDAKPGAAGRGRATAEPPEAGKAPRNRRSENKPEAELGAGVILQRTAAMSRASALIGPDDDGFHDAFSGRAGRARHPRRDVEAGMAHPPLHAFSGRVEVPEGSGPPAGIGRGNARGPEEAPGREVLPISGMRTPVGVSIPAGNAADVDRPGKRPPAAEVPFERFAAGRGRAASPAEDINIPKVSLGRRRESAPGGDAGDAEGARPRSRAAAPQADSDGGSSATRIETAGFRPEGVEDRIPGSRFGGTLRPDVSEDAAEPRWNAPSWPPLPGEDPSDGNLGPGRSGPWPLLMEEVRGRAAEAPGGIEPAGIREAVRNIERLVRLEKEQAGSPWNAWPF